MSVEPPSSRRVQLRVLGPLEVLVDGAAIALGGSKQRSVLALLLTEPNHVVSVTRIIEILWGEDPPDRAPSTLQVHVSNLRKALAPAAAALGVDEIVRTQRPGYLVSESAAELDLSSSASFSRLPSSKRRGMTPRRHR